MFASSDMSPYDLPYEKIKTFLDGEMAEDEPIITGYSFSGDRMDRVMHKVFGNNHRSQSIESATSYPSYRTRLIPLEENYLEVVQKRYYNPTGF